MFVFVFCDANWLWTVWLEFWTYDCWFYVRLVTLAIFEIVGTIVVFICEPPMIEAEHYTMTKVKRT